MDRSDLTVARAVSVTDLAQAYAAPRKMSVECAVRRGGVQLMQANADLTDVLVARILEIASDGSPPTGLAVAAVGGYGRRELAPFSDIDVAFIVDPAGEHLAATTVKRAFRMLTEVLDQAGVAIGYSYRRLDDLVNIPLEVQTALLDARLVVGSAVVFNAFETVLRQAIVPARFVMGHIESRTTGRNGFGTPFFVEPDIKEGGGGIRDLHTARWVGQVAFGLYGQDVWEGLRSEGIVTDEDVAGAEEAREFLSRTRNVLHLLAGRALDQISPERRPQLAEYLGFGSEQSFASAYYHHGHSVRRLFGKVAASAVRADLLIEPGVVARDGRLVVRDHGLFRRDASALLRMFRHAQEFRLAIAPETAELIAGCAENFRADAKSSRTFLDILSRPGAGAALRAMADLDILQAVVPQFGELLYLLPLDAAHRFTVGEHSLRTVEELEALFEERDERFADMLARLQNTQVLFLAALMHDFGKLDRSGDHSESGAYRAESFARSLGMSEDAGGVVGFLVRHHLIMAETARLRDLARPETIRNFVKVVSDPQVLDMLFLLTVADGRAVGSTNWSRVQLRFLKELHERAAAALRSGAVAGRDIERHRTRVRRELRLASLPAELVDEHCESMPAAYLLNTPPEELAAHIGYVRTARTGLPVVDLKDDRVGEFTVLTVVAPDRPGLLADIAGVMYALGIHVHAAQVFTRSSTDRIAVDTVYIDFEGRPLTELKKCQAEGELLSVLKGELSVTRLLAKLGRREYRDFREEWCKVDVKVVGNLSAHETVIEVHAPDEPGLLYRLTRTITGLGWNIHSARVAVWGDEARYVFYVTDRAGSRLSTRQVSLLRDRLRETG